MMMSNMGHLQLWALQALLLQACGNSSGFFAVAEFGMGGSLLNTATLTFNKENKNPLVLNTWNLQKTGHANSKTLLGHHT